jgi:hypothetical protein
MNMHKILVALPCLLVAGLVLSGDAEAAKKKVAAKSAPKAEAAPVTLAADSKRFNMTQDGKKMTADDFDAWMKKNGYRVATGAPAQPAKPAEEPKKGSK